MDRSQLIAFCDYAIGARTVGSDGADTIDTPHSPELRAFIVARLGDLTPANGHTVMTKHVGYPRWPHQAKAFAALLREVADGIDPPTQEPAP